MPYHLRLGLPKGLFPVCLPVKILKALLPISILAKLRKRRTLREWKIEQKIRKLLGKKTETRKFRERKTERDREKERERNIKRVRERKKKRINLREEHFEQEGKK